MKICNKLHGEQVPCSRHVEQMSYSQFGQRYERKKRTKPQKVFDGKKARQSSNRQATHLFSVFPSFKSLKNVIIIPDAIRDTLHTTALQPHVMATIDNSH